MSIPVVMDAKVFRNLKKELLKEQDLICLDSSSFIAAKLVGLQLAMRGKIVKAKIIAPEAK